MLEALEKRELDLAILLTEGIAKHAICTGLTRIIGTFVDAPLPWGVHVSPNKAIGPMADLNANIENLTFGISRFGSGSHLMAIVHACSLGKRSPQFKVVNTMAGARDAMVAGEIDVFLWDVTTADVHAREGAWKCIGTVSGDWPAFVFAVRSDVDETTLSKIRLFMAALESECSYMKSHQSDSVEYLQNKYSISPKQATEFISTIQWNARPEFSAQALETVTKSLAAAGIIPDSASGDVVKESFCSLV
jgi:ABC-type nitrate/sulfonate/bicarbonate transport system substrate-binding protein